MYETATELRDLQTLIDTSIARSTTHLRSIIAPGRDLTAAQTVELLTGMCVLTLATVTAAGEPRVSAVDGHFLHGRWVFGTAVGAAKARHLRVRPAASVSHVRGEDLGVFVHGTAETVYSPGRDPHPDWPALYEHLHAAYGDDSFGWSDVVYYRLTPTWMAVYASNPQQLLGATAD